MEREILPIGAEQETLREKILSNLAGLKHFHFSSTNPAMRVWISMVEPAKVIFPWWSYRPDLDEDIKALNDIWQVSDPTCFFDLLFLSTLKKHIGGDLFLILSGAIHNENWQDVSAAARYAFSSGEECQYQLQGNFSERLSIHWSPLWQPQRVVKAPALPVLWRLFRQSAGEDTPRVLSFFFLPELKNFDAVLDLLRKPETERSVKLAKLVSWFGLYSSSSIPGSRPGCVVYSKEEESLDDLEKFRLAFAPLYEQAKAALAQDPSPRTVLKFLNAHFTL